ncbi:MAG TPA: hypothetical protein DDW31_09195 [candidate division Zixibacteria bacterium]|jgi:hypothetical protein|nr:hypothetical protein [candidate division Zixibacteria bacterium]
MIGKIACTTLMLAPACLGQTATALAPGARLQRGEKLLYSIEYAGINAGFSYIRIDSQLTYARGRPAYHLVNETWSNPFFSKFYRVHDRSESFVDAEALVSLKFQKRIREGSYRHEEEVEFDHQANKAHYSTGQAVDLVPGSRDILLTLFYYRLFPMEVGKSIYIDNHTDKRNYPLEVRVLRRERLNTIFGKVDCLVVEPVLRTPGLFEHKGRLWVWLTDDQRRIPVLMKSKIVIGSINGVLKEYYPPLE